MDIQATKLKNGMYFQVHMVKDGKMYSSDLRDLAKATASITETITTIAFVGQEAVDNALHNTQ